MQKRLRQSRCYKRKICSMPCAANIPVEQETNLAAITIALLEFTRLWNPTIHFQSKPSNDFPLRQGLQTFLSNSHITYCTTVWGRDVFRNVILSGYVTFYRINKCFAKYCFLLMTILSSWAGWKGFLGRIWSAGGSLKTPTPKIDLQNLRTFKTWILSGFWAAGWRMQLIA